MIKHRDALASALAVDEVQLIVERVRGKGGHAGRVFLWVADEDPYAGPPLRTPLLDVEWWDAWRPVPFGRDARQRRIDLPLVWTSLLVGAIPRQGKTFATRLAAGGLILDPYTRLYMFDGKGGKDWEAAEQVAYRFVCGDELDHAEAVRDHLIELVAEVQAGSREWPHWMTRSVRSRRSPGHLAGHELGMPITAVIIDEVQVFLENPTRQQVGGKKTTLGRVHRGPVDLPGPKGPAAGIVVILATQRPDSNTIPSRLAGGAGFTFRAASDGLAGLQHRAGRADEHARLRRLHPAAQPQRCGDSAAGRRHRRRGGRAGHDRAHVLHAQPGVAGDLRARPGTCARPQGHWPGTRPATTPHARSIRPVWSRRWDRQQVRERRASEARRSRPVSLPEPLASVVDYLGRRDRGTRVHPDERTGGGAGRRADLVRPADARLGCQPVRDYAPQTGRDGSARARLLHGRDPSGDRRRTRTAVAGDDDDR